jgi:hypothetical protein
LVIFFESGRLGNQLLQYAVLRDLFADHRLVFFGCDSLRKAVRCERTWFIPATRWLRPVTSLLCRLIDRLAAFGVIGEAQEQYDDDTCRLATRKGRLHTVVLVRPSYFQHPAFEQSLTAKLELDAEVMRAAGDFVSRHASGDRAPVFLHVRRGDYLSFPTREAPAVLSADWVLAALAELRKAVPRAIVFACSDDQEWVRSLLGEADDIVYCGRGEVGDLAVMALCIGGVLSASSFSWCAAFLAHGALAKRGRTGVFIGPRYWVGHRRREWYPAGFVFPWISYR